MGRMAVDPMGDVGWHFLAHAGPNVEEVLERDIQNIENVRGSDLQFFLESLEMASRNLF